MSYHIYTTKSLVLSAKARGEADRVYSILTRDLGLVRAVGLAVRKENSKLRGGLEPVSLSIISLVRGKEYWRLTSAEFIKKVKKSKALAILEKLVAGETPHPELFDAVGEFLSKPGFDNETQFVATILSHLGYLKKSDLNLDKKNLIKAINEGLKQSHLV